MFILSLHRNKTLGQDSFLLQPPRTSSWLSSECNSSLQLFPNSNASTLETRDSRLRPSVASFLHLESLRPAGDRRLLPLLLPLTCRDGLQGTALGWHSKVPQELLGCSPSQSYNVLWDICRLCEDILL